MKKIVVAVLAFCSIPFTNAQNIQEAKKQIYNERYTTAKGILEAVTKNEAAPPEAWYWLGEIALKQKNIEAAKNILQEGIAITTKQGYSKKKEPLVYIGWAHMLMDSGMIAEAKNQMEDVLKETKYRDPQALWAVARANVDSKNGDSAWAVELLKAALKRDKKNPELYLALGDAYAKMVDGGNAIINYDKALDADPSYAAAMYKKGKIYKTQNNPEVYVDRFIKAYDIDSTYAPALFELYVYYYQFDVNKAKKFLDAYLKNADSNPEQEYMKTDLSYVSRKYEEAIKNAKKIITREGANTQPRLYKLIAYSLVALGDSAAALENIDQYFQKQDESGYVARDYELKANLLEHLNSDKSLAVSWYEQALAVQTDAKEKLGYMIKLADLQKTLGNRSKEGMWRAKIYENKTNPTNLDIYNWGLALYYSGDSYEKADSVFAIYQEKYPEQIYGYLWRARSNALIDTTMEKGLAVPHYEKVIAIASADSIKNKAILLRAYEYLGGYEATITKDYEASLEYFDKLLELDPENADANKNTVLLKKWIEEGKGIHPN